MTRRLVGWACVAWLGYLAWDEGYVQTFWREAVTWHNIKFLSAVVAFLVMLAVGLTAVADQARHDGM